MSKNLTIEGDSDYHELGPPDTYTPRSDGASAVNAAVINGVAKAMVQLQTLLGNALTLKGVRTDLITRLAQNMADDGSLRNGIAFPSTPVPLVGDLFYRTDGAKTLYIYDGTTWRTMFEGGGGGSIDHGVLSGLADDDHILYPLLAGGRDFTGNQQIQKAVPLFRWKGTEANAKEYGIFEDTGDFVIAENTGSEGTPTWADRYRYDTSATRHILTGILEITGSLDTPIIADFASANHTHLAAASGGLLTNVVRSTLNVAVGGVSGSLATGESVDVAMDAYCFYPMISTNDVNHVIRGHPTDGASADAPRFSINYSGGGAMNYNVDWRYIKATV